MADPKKIVAMLDWPISTNIKSLRGFLGSTSYYHKFIKDYRTIAAPLTDLLRKNNFQWTNEATKAFRRLNTTIITPPVLKLLDFSLPFIIKCDASGR